MQVGLRVVACIVAFAVRASTDDYAGATAARMCSSACAATASEVHDVQLVDAPRGYRL
jgi:hypothetical protein